MTRLERRQRAELIDAILTIADRFELPLEDGVVIRAIATADTVQLFELYAVLDRLRRLPTVTLH